MERIVVGVDGSKGSHAALGRAVSEAKLRGARLRVVCAWFISAEVYRTGVDQATFDSFREDAEAIVRDSLTEAERIAPGVPSDGEAIQGQAAEVLLREAQGASLIVVGNRGCGGFAGLLLGSVSQQVVH